MNRVQVLKSAAVALIFGLTAVSVSETASHAVVPDSPRRAPTSNIRVVTGGFGINSVSTPLDPRCTGGTGAVLTGSLNRTGLTPWPFTVTGCLGSGPAPTFTMTTGRGIVIVGAAGFIFQGTFLSLTFDVLSASSEYVGGHIVMAGDAENPRVPMVATGQLIVGRR